MKRKYVILALSLILIGLIIAKCNVDRQYPLEVLNYDYFKTSKEKAMERKLTQLIADRVGFVVSPQVFWEESLKFGSPIPDFLNNTTDTSICYKNVRIPADVYIRWGDNKTLEQVNVVIKKSYATGIDFTNMVKEYYGNQYLHLSKERTYSDRINDFYWIFDSYYVGLEDRTSDHSRDSRWVLSLGSTRGLSEYDLRDVEAYGIISSSMTLEEHESYIRSYSRTRTYKYGDSDTYQGSSQQKADLKAIDDYFGF